MSDIDSLRININATATKANDALDNLVKKLDKLTTSLSSIDGSKLNSLASGVSQLSTAMQTMNNVKTADFTRLAKNLSNLNSIDTSQLGNISTNITKIGQSLSGLNGVSSGAVQITELANGIKQLGYSSATKAITNIPQLATAMKQLMKELSTAPKVSQNLIDMTNALAKLARTGASSGKAAQSLSNSFTGIYKSSGFAVSGIKKVNARLVGLIRSIAPVVGLVKLIDFGKQAMEISSDLTEVQNVVDVTFGDYKQKIEDLANVSIPELGMSELSVKEIGSRFQAMGTAMGFSTEKMADMSVELTRLTGDMASFYNVEQETMGKALQSIFTGETEPMRKYGIDLTNATIQQYALSQGITTSINKMTQLEKAQLRYNYVMAQTTAAQGDFIRTQDTWANQIRILKENLKQLASIIGGSLINAFKPLVQAINSAMSHIISFAQTVSNALGKIFGWKFEVGGGITNDLDDGAGSADDIADGIGEAADNAKKLRQQLQGFDNLNVLTTDNNTSNGSGASGSSSNAGGSSSDGKWIQQDSIFKEFESEIDSLYKLGEYIRDALIGAMESIDWDSVYEKARGFGKGLAEFLNGLLAYDGEGRTLFGEVGKTLANTLNTVVYSALEFAKEFDFYQFGVNIADGINNFFENFDFESLAETLNEWVDGLKGAIAGFLDTITWEKVIEATTDFLGVLDIDTVEVLIGAFLLKNSKTNLLSLLGSAIVGKFTFSVTIPEILLTISSFSLGNMSGASFQVIGNQILEKIEETLSGILPDWLQEFIGGLVLGFSVGGVLSGGNPIVALITGLISGISSINIDGTSIAHHLLDPILNWDATQEIWESAKENFKKGGLNIILGIAEGIFAALGFLIEPIGDLFMFIFGAICSVFGIHSPATEMEPIGGNIILGLLEGITESLKNIGMWIKTHVFQPFIDGFKNAFGIHSPSTVMEEQGGFIVDGLLDGLKKKINDVWEWAKRVPDEFVEFFNDLPGNFLSIGEDVINGLWNGMKNIWKNVTGWISDAGNAISGILKDVLDIHSPSRVMIKLGGFTIEGFKEGMENLYKPTLESLKEFSYDIEAAPAPGIESMYERYQPAYTNSYTPGYFDMRYLNTGNQESNSETNGLLRELITAVRQGRVIEMNGREVGKELQRQDEVFYKRTGKGMFQH